MRANIDPQTLASAGILVKAISPSADKPALGCRRCLDWTECSWDKIGPLGLSYPTHTDALSGPTKGETMPSTQRPRAHCCAVVRVFVGAFLNRNAVGSIFGRNGSDEPASEILGRCGLRGKGKVSIKDNAELVATDPRTCSLLRRW